MYNNVLFVRLVRFVSMVHDVWFMFILKLKGL